MMVIIRAAFVNLMRPGLVIFLVTLVLLGCKKEKKAVSGIQGTYVSERMRVIPVTPEVCVDRVKYSDIIDPQTVAVIPLETNDSSLLGNMKQMKVKGGKIYIEDRLQKSVFVFSEQGKYLTKIDHFGRGPEEYASLWDFCIEDSLVGMLNFDRILFYNQYNGEYVKQVRLDSLGIGAVSMYSDKDHYYFRLSNVEAIKASGVVCDKDFSLVNIFSEPRFAELLTAEMTPFFIPMEKKVYYHQTYNDTLYEITDTGLLASYVFDCGENYLSYSEKMKHVDMQKPVPDHYIYSLCQYHYADSVISFAAFHASDHYWGLYSLRTEKLKLLKYSGGEDDIFNLGLHWTAWASDSNGYFYGIIYPGYLLERGLKIPSDSPFAGLSDDSNLVVIKFKLKKF